MLVDSNIIVYAINTSSPKHKRAQEFCQQKKSNLVVTHQNVLESLRVLTHPKFSHPMAARSALRAVNAIVSAFSLITPLYETLEITQMFMKEHSLVADKIFDAYLVATMLTHGITEIATDNERDFALYRGIKVVNPFRTRGN
ncbi:hypothetical protein A3A79_03430 [Candidatus Gottesmanbacteria bacterium RIFCSPLOWO2_01_FULL_43_11b]|uniref:Ribonuclease VapC n=1 Tax=Candidatus Gottesmanbacteria bacterium RIFCSPLOWO2_01_FULL_43_11b TaxID=1798392 RepID=A0A1F6AHL7_9BACT|nr:MAG: hypothetical protein A3A79_03430 [Candidatus Gottesmanbacteria bacterium RIFCSPLOWO2_01_FULL_43_11b]